MAVPAGEPVGVAATVAAEAELDAAVVALAAAAVVEEAPDAEAARSLLGTAGSAMRLRVGQEARWVLAAVAVVRDCTSVVMRIAAAVRCGCMCAG